MDDEHVVAGASSAHWPPVGEWLCLNAETTLASGSVGVATSSVYDEHGLVARTAQALLIARRPA